MTDEQYMQRCLDLAQNAWPACRPNPMVGALLVHEGEVISEGFTSVYGGPHAEVNAISGVDDAILKASTLYVSLEPCAHHGKTPPCADLIVAKGIPRVVIGCRDPFHAVDGKGLERLQTAGIEVRSGVLEKECRWQNRRFMTFHEKQRPYIILKWAESADGYIDTERDGGKAAKISSLQTDQRVHQWRAEEQAILVGGNTARKDDPSLTTRLVHGPDPKRFVWTSKLLDPDSKLSKLGYTALSADSVDGVLTDLYEAGVQSVLIEGGARVHQQFIDSGVFDEIRRVVGQPRLGAGVKAPVIDQAYEHHLASGTDQVCYYFNTL